MQYTFVKVQFNGTNRTYHIHSIRYSKTSKLLGGLEVLQALFVLAVHVLNLSLFKKLT